MGLPAPKGKKFGYYVGAMRLPFLTASIMSVLLGSAIAYHEPDGVFYLGRFLLALLGAALVHTAANLANDYYDHTSENDWVNKTPTMFSGGSRYIQEKQLSPRWFLGAALVCFGIVAAIGLYLNWVTPGNTILYIGLAGFFLGFFYTAAPLRIGYTPVGELAILIAFGPCIAVGSYYVQTGALSLTPLLASIPVGLLVALILYINGFQDHDADKKVGKKTLIVTLGKKRAATWLTYFLVIYFVMIIAGVIGGYFPIYALAVVVGLPLVIRASTTAKQCYDKVDELLPANGSVIGFHLVSTLLFSIAFLVDKWI
jgi:1,4-dihydroxy-2-naphthoate octaprenyltransferase